jgi:hypothetical protein
MEQKPDTDAPQISTLAQMRDEIRLKVHLAGMEAKTKWQELEQQLEGLEQRVAGDGGVLRDASAQLARDLKRSLLDFRDRLSA